MIFEYLLQDFYRKPENVREISTPLFVKGYFKRVSNGVPYPADDNSRFVKIDNDLETLLDEQTANAVKKMEKKGTKNTDFAVGCDTRTPDKIISSRPFWFDSYGLHLTILGTDSDDLTTYGKPYIYFGGPSDTSAAIAGILGGTGVVNFCGFKKSSTLEKLLNAFKKLVGKDIIKPEFDLLADGAKEQGYNNLFTDKRKTNKIKQVGFHCSEAGEIIIESHKEKKFYEVGFMQPIKEKNPLTEGTDSLEIHTNLVRSLCTCSRFTKRLSKMFEDKLFFGYCKHANQGIYALKYGENHPLKGYSKINPLKGFKLEYPKGTAVPNIPQIHIAYEPLMQDSTLSKELNGFALLMRFVKEYVAKKDYLRRRVDLALLDYWDIILNRRIVKIFADNMLPEYDRKKITAESRRILEEQVKLAPPIAVAEMEVDGKKQNVLLKIDYLRGNWAFKK